MKTSKSAVSGVGLRLTAMVILSSVVAACAAGNETFQYGGSTAVVEQRGGAGTSRSEVERFGNGQKIVTRNGSSMDIVIQESDSHRSLGHGWHYADSGADRFDRGSVDERFSRAEYDGSSIDDCTDCTAWSTREAFKQRMLERMGGGFPR